MSEQSDAWRSTWVHEADRVRELAAERGTWQVRAEEAEEVAGDLRAEVERLRMAVKVMLEGDVTLCPEKKFPGIGFDYSYVRTTPEVLAILDAIDEDDEIKTPDVPQWEPPLAYMREQ